MTLIVFLFSQVPGHATDAPVVILKSTDSVAHNEAVRNIKKSLQNQRVVVFNLNHNADNIYRVMENVALISPKIIIGVGNSAIIALKSAPEMRIPAVFCLVTNLNGALSRAQSWVVPLQSHPKYHAIYLNRFFSKKSIGIPFNPNRSQAIINDLVSFFRARSIKLYPFPVEGPEEMSTMLKTTESHYDALWIIPDNSIIDGLTLPYIHRYAQIKQMPLIGFSDEMTQQGAILSISGSYADMGQQAGLTAQKILSGHAPRKKIQYPRISHQYFNTQVAGRLNIPIPNQKNLIETAFIFFPQKEVSRVP